MTLTVGLTGGIGAGKSLALSELARLGAWVLDTDEVARSQAKPVGTAYGKIVKAFGREILNPDGTIDRKRLAERVFKNGRQRRLLEKITHPLILNDAFRRLKAAKGVAVVAVPLLFETSLEDRFDVTLTIEAPIATRLRRVARRDSVAAERLKSQLSSRARQARADVVIHNIGTKKRLSAQLRLYYQAMALLRHGAEAARRHGG